MGTNDSSGIVSDASFDRLGDIDVVEVEIQGRSDVVLALRVCTSTSCDRRYG